MIHDFEFFFTFGKFIIERKGKYHDDRQHQEESRPVGCLLDSVLDTLEDIDRTFTLEQILTKLV